MLVQCLRKNHLVEYKRFLFSAKHINYDQAWTNWNHNIYWLIEVNWHKFVCYLSTSSSNEHLLYEPWLLMPLCFFCICETPQWRFIRIKSYWVDCWFMHVEITTLIFQSLKKRVRIINQTIFLFSRAPLHCRS